MPINFKTKTASLNDIIFHLRRCNESFIPYLDKKVNLTEFSHKIFANTVTFEAWDNNCLIGLVSAYFNDSENLSCFINNVSIDPKFINNGIASQLLHACLAYAKEHDFKLLSLEVAANNLPAMALYAKFQFAQSTVHDNNIIMTKPL